MQILVKNDLLDQSSSLYWEDSEFTRKNFPSAFDFEIDVKRDIFDMSRQLPTNSGIIDCGAHIGDLSIPLASALSDIGRADVTIYALDPSADKCAFMHKMVAKNRLKNVVIINCGLSDRKETRYPHIPIDGNTGGTCWLMESVNTNSNAHEYVTGSAFTFDTLDNMVDGGIITRSIGLIHLDVENMEPEALYGAIKTIESSKPMISLEDHQNDANVFLEILGSDYSFSHRIINNSIFTPYTSE